MHPEVDPPRRHRTELQRIGRRGSVILREYSKDDEQIIEGIEAVALQLWGDEIIPTRDSSWDIFVEGEAELGQGVPFQERVEYFHREALQGCPKSQHSYGLLLWSGFAGVERDAVESAKFHATAASQNQ